MRDYEVDIMNLQRAKALVPPSSDGGLIEVQLESGATLKIAHGDRVDRRALAQHERARRSSEYRNKGVAYCPHCDGPLFKGKRVAVIGGGNSGVEAAIDLAGLVAHVTLLEFAGELRPTPCCSASSRACPTCRSSLNAQTTEITGDGSRSTA